jgi:hypothetical protein
MKKLFTTKIGSIAISALAIILSVGATVMPSTAQNAEAWAPTVSDLAWDWNECSQVEIPEKKEYQELTIGKRVDKASPNLQLESCENVVKVSP